MDKIVYTVESHDGGGRMYITKATFCPNEAKKWVEEDIKLYREKNPRSQARDESIASLGKIVVNLPESRKAAMKKLSPIDKLVLGFNDEVAAIKRGITR